MKFIVAGSQEAFVELSTGLDHLEWQHVPHSQDFAKHADANAFFNLNEDAWQESYTSLQGPVFINSVINPLGSNTNAIRFNGWTGFINHSNWEIAGDLTDAANDVLKALNKNCILTTDEPGFISARIVAMIINEAWYALGEDISTEAEIDIAMKLGTNYPYGPFEWGHIIGIKNIYNLLQTMAEENKKYTPAPRLQQLIQAQ